MNRIHIYIVLFALVCTTLSLKAQDKESIPSLNTLGIGVKGGINLSNIAYSDPAIAEYESKAIMRGGAGIFMNIPLSAAISVRPELLYLGKGQQIHDGVSYLFKPNYFDWRLPLLYHFALNKNFQPYILVAPTLGFASGGKIILDDWQCDVTTASIAPIEFGAMAGAGFNFPIETKKYRMVGSLEATYNLGFSDTYAQGEIDEVSNALNLDQYAINGTRKNRGLAIVAGVTIPLNGFMKDSPRQRGCYTIEELTRLIQRNKKVYDKAICTDNLNFDFDKFDITPASAQYLDNVAILLQSKEDLKLSINGYTDSKGSEEYNLELSRKRSLAVYDYLIKKGINKNRLSYAYFGEADALKNNTTERKRAVNRRVELEITK